MGVAILTIGTELTRGEVADGNATWLSAQLTDAGFEVACKTTVPDDCIAIADALRMLTAKYQFVLATGGLGPTSDDVTARAAAESVGVELVRDESALLAIRRRLEARGREMTKAHEKQADLPVGSEILPNAVGTAPGFVLRNGHGSAFFMPGVPREMHRMFEDQVLPRVGSSAPNNRFQVRLRTYGLGESAIMNELGGIEEEFPEVRLGFRAHSPQVDVKILAEGQNPAHAREIANRVAVVVRDRLGEIVFGEGDEDLPQIVARGLRGRGFRIALAESCTGGLISHLLTTHAGASEYLVGSAVTYANSAKSRLLAVPEDTIRAHGAVSAEVAAAMAEGVRRAGQADLGLSVTGIAGPSGGTQTKPVGLVHWALAHPDGTLVRERVFHGDRSEIRLGAAYAALDLVRRYCLGLEVEFVVSPPSIPPP